MALGVSNPFSTYLDSGRCLLQTRGSRCQIDGPSPPQFMSFLYSQHTKHRGCLGVARRPTVVVCIHNYKITGAPTPVTRNSWEELVLKNESVVLVEFYASWCGPCQMVHRVINEIAAEYKGKLDCYVLDTDLDLPLAEEYEVKAVPVVLLFKNGQKHDCIVGTMPKEFYVAAIEKVLVS